MTRTKPDLKKQIEINRELEAILSSASNDSNYSEYACSYFAGRANIIAAQTDSFELTIEFWNAIDEARKKLEALHRAEQKRIALGDTRAAETNRFVLAYTRELTSIQKYLAREI